MPQQLPTRASLRTSTRARRTPRVHATTTVVAALAAAALTATTAVPAALPAARAATRTAATPDTSPDARAVTVTSTGGGAEVADVHVDPQVAAAAEAAVVQASGALAEAEHVTIEGSAAPAEQIAQIAQTTSVVRELVRRVSTADEPHAAQPGAASDATSGQPAGTPATPTDATGPADTREEPTPATGAPAVDPAIGAAADAAVSAVAGAETAVADVGTEALATALAQQTAALAQLVEATPATAITVKPAGPTPEEIAAKKAAEEAAARKAAEEAAAREAARLAALAAEAKQHGNGQIPGRLLAPLPWSPHNMLRADAAAHLTRLNEAFRATFGTDLGVTDSYRSYGDQVAVKKKRGFWAARPGYSNHGFGVAVDLGTGIASFGTPQYRWMKKHAPAYGWIHPDWAEPGGRKPEPWHWEFVG